MTRSASTGLSIASCAPIALRDRIDRSTVDDRIGPREIDMLEDARARRDLREGADRAHFAVLARSPARRARPGGRRWRRRRRARRFRKRRSSSRRAGPSPAGGCRADRGRRSCLRASCRSANRRLRPACSASMKRSIKRAEVRGGDEVDDRFGVAGRLEDRAAADELAPQLHRVGDIAVMRDREAAARRGRHRAAGRCAAQFRPWSNSGHGRTPSARRGRG